MLHRIKQVAKRVALLRMAAAVRFTLREQFGFRLTWLTGIWRLMGFALEYRRYARLNEKAQFKLNAADIFPCLTDRTETTPIEPIYFLQDTWCAGRIAAQRPVAHVDVGSSVKSLALVAQFVPVRFVDIRAVDIIVPGFTFVGGSVLELPFATGSVASLSSLCVIEHIGLGRYGDPVDAWGSEKAAAELSRVLAPGGDLYISVPVDASNRIYFNAHRAFTRDYVLTCFKDLVLVEERYIYGRQLELQYDPRKGFGTGLYHLRRP